MIFDSIILKLKGIMYLVYCVVSKIHLFIFLLKVANFAQRDPVNAKLKSFQSVIKDSASLNANMFFSRTF